jgi:nitrogen fixation NifU-like protein
VGVVVGNVDYNANVLDHFRNPRNMGELKGADAEAVVGNPTCGDVMKIMLKVEDYRIVDVKFLTMGCAAAVATSSALTEMVKGMSLDEALKIKASDVTEYLGGLPGVKEHCSNLGAEALRKAIVSFREGGE